ncbi:MAG: hypothetical protein RL885_32190 [Planctomycetota bacterium]
MTTGLPKLIVLFGLWLAPSIAADDEGIHIQEKEDRLIFSVVDGKGSLTGLLEACHPYFGFELFYDHTDVANRHLPWTRMTTSRSELWGDLQALLLANDLAWIWLDANTIRLKNYRTAQRGELTGWARNATVDEALQRRLFQAEVVTVAMPLQYLDARATFTSLRQYFTNQTTEAITPIDESNSLVITGLGNVIERQAALIHELDRPGRKTASHELRLYRLEHANVDYVLRDVEQFLQQRQPQPAQTTTSRLTEPEEVVLPVDERDALIVWGRPETLAQLDALIPLLDREEDSAKEESKKEPAPEKQQVLGPVELPSDKGLEKSLAKYFEARDELGYGERDAVKLEKMNGIVGRMLEKAARKNRWHTDRRGELQTALIHTDWLRGPMNRFPDYPRLKTNRVIPASKDSEEPYWLSVPPGYRHDRGFWPIVLILLGQEHEDERQWLEALRAQQPELIENAVLLVPERPMDGDGPMAWDTGDGLSRALRPLAETLWDRVRVDQDRIFLAGFGSASQAAASVAARFALFFAGLAIERDIPAEDWQLDLASLPTLSPPGYFASAHARREGDVLLVRDWPADLAPFIAHNRRVRFPEQIHQRVSKARRGGAWILASQLDDRVSEETPASFEATLERASNRIRIESQGIRRFQLWLNDEMLDLDLPVRVEINDRVVFRDRVERDLETLLDHVYHTSERSRLFTSTLTLDVPEGR